LHSIALQQLIFLNMSS